jgi:hypothetical protein
MEGEWHALLCTGLHKRLGSKLPLVGLAGGWGSSVYLDGRDVPGAGATRTGQLAIVIQGDLAAAAEAGALSSPHDPAATAAQCRAVAAAVGSRLRPSQPQLVFAFGAASGGVVAEAFGGAAVFGGTGLAQAGTDAEGKLHVGSDRLVLCAVGEASPP